MRLLTERARFLVECLDLPAATQVDDARWEHFQIAHLNDDSIFRIEDKSRQIAWSWTQAAEAVASAILHGESTVFVSINLEEAKEKARYAQLVHEALDVTLDGHTECGVLGLEFSNGARIKSLPSRPPRGKTRMNIVLDEFAHVQYDRKIYTAALPILSRGGRIRVGSSTMGARGMFWEISQQELRAYPDYNRVQTPWWEVKAFCKSTPSNPEALDTAGRVEKWGCERIALIYNNMLLDDFQQEYECVYVDETVSFFTWELIRANQDSELLYYHVKDPAGVEDAVQSLHDDIASGKVERFLAGGVDVGRKRNLTEIILVGLGTDKFPLRLMISLDKVKFDTQEHILRRIVEVLPIAGLLIDDGGLGMQLAENLSSNTIAEGATFTNASKQQWATELKIQMERWRMTIPTDRDLAYQIHSVKKMVTAAKHNVFDTEKNEKHHADKFWALALAAWVVREYEDRPEWGPGLNRSR